MFFFLAKHNWTLTHGIPSESYLWMDVLIILTCFTCINPDNNTLYNPTVLVVPQQAENKICCAPSPALLHLFHWCWKSLSFMCGYQSVSSLCHPLAQGWAGMRGGCEEDPA